MSVSLVNEWQKKLDSCKIYLLDLRNRKIVDAVFNKLHWEN